MTKCHPTKPFRCPGVKNVCISLAYLCDGQPDCEDGYDEDTRLCVSGMIFQIYLLFGLQVVPLVSKLHQFYFDFELHSEYFFCTIFVFFNFLCHFNIQKSKNRS